MEFVNSVQVGIFGCILNSINTMFNLKCKLLSVQKTSRFNLVLKTI